MLTDRRATVSPIVKTVYLLRRKKLRTFEIIYPYHNIEKTLNYYTNNFIHLKTASNAPALSRKVNLLPSSCLKINMTSIG